MENKAERFWLYLIERKLKIASKLEIEKNYKEFEEMWKIKEKDFYKVFDVLRKSRIKYIFNKEWYILNQEEFQSLKNGKIEEYEFIFRFLENKEIPYYVGLSSAKYLNKLTWQSLNKIQIINTRFKLKRKISNIEVELIKFPKQLIINIALSKTNNGFLYSDIEKTFLDEIFYKKTKSPIGDFNITELNLEKIKAYLAFYLKYKFVEKEVLKQLKIHNLEL